MATCKDCLYFKRCVVLGVELDMHHSNEADKNCRHFKNKADFVEVPCKCSECKYLKIINKKPIYAECERQKLTFLLWEADTREHFCSYGERKLKNDFKENDL